MMKADRIQRLKDNNIWRVLTLQSSLNFEMELEEERKSHKERDQCIKEQQMKTDNLNTRVNSSDGDKSSSQVWFKQIKTQ